MVGGYRVTKAAEDEGIADVVDFREGQLCGLEEGRVVDVGG